jgi:hypothetical protein
VPDLPDSLDLHALGLEPSEVRAVTLLSQAHGHALYRLECEGKSLVLKCFAGEGESPEVQSYALLERLGVPTISVYGRTHNALLLEDLESSRAWRLADEEDSGRAEIGTAVAGWYGALHSAGSKLMQDPKSVPAYLHRETDALDATTILRIGKWLDLAGKPVWALAANHIDALKSAIEASPTTLTYNDFHWTNLALSREEWPALRAIIFDYHLIGIGPAYSDYRNVLSVLHGPAAPAFKEEFGPVDERDAILDAPTAVLYSLYEASRLPRLPGWAGGLVQEAESGDLEAKLRAAIAVLQ